MLQNGRICVGAVMLNVMCSQFITDFLPCGTSYDDFDFVCAYSNNAVDNIYVGCAHIRDTLSCFRQQRLWKGVADKAKPYTTSGRTAYW